jgi:hypothetical protein
MEMSLTARPTKSSVDETMIRTDCGSHPASGSGCWSAPTQTSASSLSRRRRAVASWTDFPGRGVAVLIASLDDLESMTRAAGRPKDLLEVEEIAAIRRLRRQLGRD